MLGEARSATAVQARDLSRTRERLVHARSLDELCAELAPLLAGLYRPASRCELFVARDGELVGCLHRDGVAARASRTLLASLVARLLASRRPLFEPQSLAAHETPARRPVITAPVLDAADDLLAVLVVEGAPSHPDFTPLERVALEGIAAQLALAAPSCLSPSAEATRARTALDRQAACRIQRGFMSSHLPAGAGVTAHAEYLPAFDVGGDFYNVSYLGDQTVSATIGDVSGNGVSAALLMSRVSADVERAVAAGPSPAAVLSAVDAGLGGGASDMFVTAACVRIDARRHRLTVANAGHLPLVVRRADGEVFTFGGASGTPLGMLPCEYAEDELLLEQGDIVLLATDGLLEALDHPSGHHGLELLRAEVHAAGHDPLAINARLRDAVERARREHPLDDVTWVTLQLAP